MIGDGRKINLKTTPQRKGRKGAQVRRRQPTRRSGARGWEWMWRCALWKGVRHRRHTVTMNCTCRGAPILSLEPQTTASNVLAGGPSTMTGLLETDRQNAIRHV